ncbi:MAG: DNA translocase FtsK, partial [Oscillospiraceae bacterium]|nr:DNA translocase FtsK [Oscillospiraceae bacterium]
IIILLLFVFIMLVTRTGLMTLFRGVGHSAKKTKETLARTKDTVAGLFTGGDDEPDEIEIDNDIDVDMGEGYPNTVVETPTIAALTKQMQALHEEDDDAVFDAPMDGAPTASAVPKEKKEKQKKDTRPAYMSPDDPDYQYPPLTLLQAPPAVNPVQTSTEQRQTADLLVSTLRDYGVDTRILDISQGPAVTRYELQPSAGVKISRITNLADDIALRLATVGVRIEAPIPNKAAVGIEVPNKTTRPVVLRELIESKEFSRSEGKLAVALGEDITGGTVIADLAKMPHLIIAGTTGAGKSVCTHAMIQSVLFKARPKDVMMLLIDPKRVEFGVYNGIPHLLVPVVTDPRKAAGALGWAVTEMNSRYKTFAEHGVRDLESYNQLAVKEDDITPLPLILIVIDELADLMMAASNEVEDAIIRLAQMARAAGMHLVIATQRPSVDVITGLIKANIPSRLALTVASAVDSRTILDAGGAEKLLGRGDMLFQPIGYTKPLRVQGCFVSHSEVEAVVRFLKENEARHEYDEQVMQEIERQATSVKSGQDAGGDDLDSDDMLPQAIDAVVEAGMASTSLLQRKLRLGYARAGRMIDEMERRGIIGPHEGSKPRAVLLSRQQWLEMKLAQETRD